MVWMISSVVAITFIVGSPIFTRTQGGEDEKFFFFQNFQHFMCLVHWIFTYWQTIVTNSHYIDIKPLHCCYYYLTSHFWFLLACVSEGYLSIPLYHSTGGFLSLIRTASIACRNPGSPRHCATIFTFIGGIVPPCSSLAWSKMNDFFLTDSLLDDIRRKCSGFRSPMLRDVSPS